MSVVVGNQLPDYVAALFDGSDLEAKLGRGYLMVTVDADGLPRPCMLSAGEILTVDSETLRLGLWAGSKSAHNLASGSHVLLCVVDEQVVLYVRGRATQLAAASGEGARLDCFDLHVDRVETDAHEGLPVSHGIGFAVVDPRPNDLLEIWRVQLGIIAAARPDSAGSRP